MTQIIPNTQAVLQVIGSAQVVVNGTNHQWLANEIIRGLKVIHVGDYSFSAEETGGGTAELKLSLQRDIGSGWEAVSGEGAAMTFTTGQDRRFRTLCKVPYYDGIDAGVLPKYRLLAECPTGQVTLHAAEGNDGVPSGQWKAEYEFDGDAPPITFTEQTPSAGLQWNAVAYGNGLFVAVATSGTGNRVMTSPDGINWTGQVSAADEYWSSIAYGNGLFVAADRINGMIMKSPDGINWTLSAYLSAITDITFGNGFFVASSSNRMYRSFDGATWSDNLTSPLLDWNAVAYGNGLFVAVATSGTGNRVITSPDGINWTGQVSAADLVWNAVAYGNGLFVATSGAGSGTNMMTSPDGINWTAREAYPSAGANLADITFGNGLFVAVSSEGTVESAMESVNGINWSQVATPSGIQLRGVTGNGNSKFVTVGWNGVALAQI